MTEAAKLSGYVVLRQTATNDEKFPAAWVIVKTVQARSQEDAVKQAADTTAAAVYTAVPSRSWVPVRVSPTTVVRFEMAVDAPVAAPAEATP